VKNSILHERFFRTFAAMFEKLQKKWKVNGLQLTLILCTFAIGGSLTGYTGRKLMPLLGIGPNWLWIIVYIILITLIWPVAVLLISIPFGQFRFFTSYLKKIGKRMGLAGSTKVEVSHQHSGSSVFGIAVFASGNGSNAQQIIDRFNHNNTSKANVALIVCNNPSAGVINIARQENIPVLLVDKEQFLHGNGYVDELKAAGIRFIVLAGFLWKLPSSLINAFPNHIINIHPALLPAYGGKGMYGLQVHQAVINNKEKESGITIHYVDELYDHGTVIFKTTCPVYNNDTAELLAQRVQELEHKHYPVVVERLLEKQLA
jgi:formyltetrahydrofolate-dependent phosphoribosylglycinamide formyltransferase